MIEHGTMLRISEDYENKEEEKKIKTKGRLLQRRFLIHLIHLQLENTIFLIFHSYHVSLTLFALVLFHSLYVRLRIKMFFFLYISVN